MNELRIVEYFEYCRTSEIRYGQKELKGRAKFRQFGVGYEQFEEGTGNYSTAIIELDDGTLLNYPVEMVRFVK